MKIQNLERRSLEYALLESQRDLESQRLQLLEDIQWTVQVFLYSLTHVMEL